jgi:hypothetical protein
VIYLYPCKTEKKKERKKDLAAAPHHVWQKLYKHCRKISSVLIDAPPFWELGINRYVLPE